MDRAEQDLNSRDSAGARVPEGSGDPRKNLTGDEHTAGSSTHQTATFSTLPIELRLTIWNLARPDPRIVRIKQSKHSPAIYSSASIPNLLHVCQESRYVALQWYQPSFGRSQIEFWNPDLPFPLKTVRRSKIVAWKVYAEPTTYFDFSRDIFYSGCERCDHCFFVACSSCHAMVHEDERKKLHRVLVRYRNHGADGEPPITPFPFINYNFPEAKDVMIYSPSTAGLRPEEMQWNRLFQSTVLLPFENEGQTLMDTYVVEAARLSVGAPRELNVERVIRVDFCTCPSEECSCKKNH